MPYADPQTRRDYAREWHARRRAAFFADKACVDCGETEDLQLDHKDPAEKVHHNIWSWSQERRDAEIAKCDVRCGDCHRERHSVERRRHGVKRYEKGCRCDICRAAKSRKNARYAERKKAA